MEKFSIPTGFEPFTLQNITDQHYCVENLDPSKQLVLISAPQKFIVQSLIGEQFVEGGCKLLEKMCTGQSGFSKVKN